jgi:heptosyltransferase-2
MSELKNRRVAYDCRFFCGDIPCIWHKERGYLCECEFYEPIIGNILIIKLDAMGDVLRTTCLLPVIADAFPRMCITWITRIEAVPLLEGNPYVSEVVAYNVDALVHLTSRTFDYVINLDAGKISSGMASIARAKERIGYALHEDGYTEGTNRAATEWLRMGIFDDLKKENQKTYQNIMCSILGLSNDKIKYAFELTDDEKEKGRKFLIELGLDLRKLTLGIHTGGGGRWKLKQWNEEGFISLISELINELGQNVQILLLGGALEQKLNSRIKEKVRGKIFDAGCDNSVRHFSALVGCCSVVLSGDSLAMHIALAMERRTVVLFGPTSSAEIELFGMGEKVIPDMDCLVCYKKECDFIPNCMDLISVDMVKEAVLRQLEIYNDFQEPQI